MVAREKLTEEEKKQLKQDIKSGKVDIYGLYDKYGIFEPYFIPYKEDEGKTYEEYEKDIEESRIDFLLAHL